MVFMITTSISQVAAESRLSRKQGAIAFAIPVLVALATFGASFLTEQLGELDLNQMTAALTGAGVGIVGSLLYITPALKPGNEGIDPKSLSKEDREVFNILNDKTLSLEEYFQRLGELTKRNSESKRTTFRSKTK